jgi:predicted metalloendopeptidase
MLTSELRQLLDQVADTREIVLRRPHTWSADFDAWSDAREDTLAAYLDWNVARTRESYVAYRAAQDREDAAQDTLAQTQMSRSSVS